MSRAAALLRGRGIGKGKGKTKAKKARGKPSKQIGNKILGGKLEILWSGGSELVIMRGSLKRKHEGP